MAQRTEKEETEFKVPETLTLCVNNCGVTGNPATNNMCQKCFNATTASSSSSSSSTSSPSQSQSSSSSSSSSVPSPMASSVLTFTAEKKPRSPPPRSPERSNNPSTSRKHGSTSSASFSSTTLSTESTTRREVNRCSGCRRKVGLTGFRCRCGELFCAEHRYSDRHDCSYDYKAAGREAIARENPVVKAAKIVRV